MRFLFAVLPLMLPLLKSFGFKPDSTFLPANSFVSLEGGAQPFVMNLPEGFQFQYIIKTGEMLSDQSSMRSNFDFTGFIPLYSADSGVLSINHELPPFSGGVTLMNLHFDKASKRWIRNNESVVDFSSVVGTAANCSGTVTPWNTLITCEEAIAPTDFDNNGYNDGGWAIEINPQTRTLVNNQKLWALGNFKHENVVIHANKRTLYQGADDSVGYLFRFVADQPENLSSGKLYAYKGPKNGSGNWVLLNNSTPAERNTVNSQCAILGCTVFAGIEDVEISPTDSLIYFAVKGENCVYRFSDGDPISGTTTSQFETYVGGFGASYSFPTKNGTVSESWGSGNDNLAFDDQGNLYVLQDGSNLGSTDYNHVWWVGKEHTQADPHVRIFLRSPVSSEPTGITFTPDYRFMFISFQHPSGGNAVQSIQDVSGQPITFENNIAVVIARNEVWGIPACQSALTLNNHRIFDCCFYSSDRIESNLPVAKDVKLEFHAVDNILLQPGFKTPENGTFVTYLDGCSKLN